jgi:hypothetical protein
LKDPTDSAWDSDPGMQGFKQLMARYLLGVLCSELERPFFVPSPAVRFPERAEGVKGPKR